LSANREKMIDRHCFFDSELDKLISAEANATGKSYAQVVRELCRDQLTNKNAEQGIDIIRSTLRTVLRDVIKPMEERLAKIEAKTAIAAATSMYLHVQMLEDIGRTDAIDMYNAARKKAVSYLRSPDENVKTEDKA